MVFLRKTYTFHEINVFGLKHDLGSFLYVFWSLGAAPGTLLAPFLVFLAALGAPGASLGVPRGSAGSSPGGSWEALGRSWSVFGHLKGFLGPWEPQFWVPAIDFPSFTSVFPCRAPRMIRANLERGGMCEAR